MNRSKHALLALAAVCALLHAGPARAHLDADAAVDELTQRIARDPDDASLFLRRGELHRIDRRWSEALADFERVRSLDPRLTLVDYCVGRTLLESGAPAAALAPLDRFLGGSSAHAGALVARARARARLGQRLAAAADYTRAIEALRPPDLPQPEHYLERAQVLAAEGGVHLEEAIRGLDEGLLRLGQPITLSLQALDLEVGRKHWDAALVRLDRIAQLSPRRAPWLARKAAILEAAGRPAAARQALAESLAAIAALPAYRRRTKATVDLETTVRSSLARLGRAEGTP